MSDIEVVAGGKALQSLANEEISGESIGDVEGEVADHGKMGRSEIIESAEIANEDSIGFGVFNQAEKSCLTGFLDAWGG